jgi:NlpC/P60 family
VADQPASATALRAVGEAKSVLGVPYVWGGVTPNGFDCSGLCQWCYEQAGVSLPRTSQEQWAAGFLDVPVGSWAPGDLVFSQWPGDDQPSPGHVVLYIGDGDTIAAPHTGTTVQREPVSTFTPSQVYVGSKRPAPLRGVTPGAGTTVGGQVTGIGSSGAALLGAGVVPVVLVGGVLLLLVGAVLLFKARPSGASSAESSGAPQTPPNPSGGVG